MRLPTKVALSSSPYVSSTEWGTKRIASLNLFCIFRYDGTVKNWLDRRVCVCGWLLAVMLLPHAGNAQRPAPKAAHTTIACGALAGQLLTCAQLGFTYRVPFGWVDRTRDMQAASGEAPDASGSATAPQKSASSSGGKTLLAVFQRPPEAPGATINSAVIVAAEPAPDYPKIKTAADYFGPLAEIAEQRGLKMDGDPYAFSVRAKQLVRGDFASGSDKTAIHQTSLVTIEKGNILSFTFVSGSEDEIDDLISALSFGARAAAKPGHRQ